MNAKIEKTSIIAILLIVVSFVQPQNIVLGHETVEEGTLGDAPMPISSPTSSSLTFCVYQDFSWWGVLGPGHAFVQLKDDATFVEEYGFYPSSGKGILGAVQGKVYDDGGHSWDWKICWTITAAQWNAIANWINPQIPNTNLQYHIFAGGTTFNCMKWAATAAAQAGITIPPYINLVGIPDPYTLGVQLENIGDGGTWGGGTVKRNPGVTPPQDPPFHAGSYLLVVFMGFESPGGFAEYFGANLIAGSMGSKTALVGQSISFVSPISVDLGGTIVAWDFGDGSRAYQTLSTSHTYNSLGDYTVAFLAVNDNTVWSFTGMVTVYADGVVSGGGIVVSVDKFGLLAPYIGLASTILVATVATAIYVKRVKRRKEKQ